MDKINLNYSLNNLGGIKQFGGIRQNVAWQNAGTTAPIQTSDVFVRGNNATVPEFQSTQIPNVEEFCTPMQLLKLYSSDEKINQLLKASPKASKMLQSKGIKAETHSSNITEISQGHLRETSVYATEIADALGLSDDDKKTLQKASVLHDYGKALIPPEILNKETALTKEEKDVINLHSELGYELLSKTNLDKRTLSLIRNHHKYANQNPDLLGQILSVADVYSALREERSYKTALSHSEAVEILNQKVETGELNQDIVDVLNYIIQGQA